YEGTEAKVRQALPGANLTAETLSMVEFALLDLAYLKAAALAEQGDSLSNALKWAGHLAHASSSVNVAGPWVGLATWSPRHALWYEGMSKAALLRSPEFADQHGYLAQELHRHAFTFARAVELELAEKFFTRLKVADVLADRLAGVYSSLVDHSGSSVR